MVEIGKEDEPLAKRVVVTCGLQPLSTSETLGALKRNSTVMKISWGTEVLLGRVIKL